MGRLRPPWRPPPIIHDYDMPYDDLLRSISMISPVGTSVVAPTEAAYGYAGPDQDR
jgi:hypothetical protein